MILTQDQIIQAVAEYAARNTGRHSDWYVRLFIHATGGEVTITAEVEEKETYEEWKK